jgi:hypothetical protein
MNKFYLEIQSLYHRVPTLAQLGPEH